MARAAHDVAQVLQLVDLVAVPAHLPAPRDPLLCRHVGSHGGGSVAGVATSRNHALDLLQKGRGVEKIGGEGERCLRFFRTRVLRIREGDSCGFGRLPAFPKLIRIVTVQP